MALQSSSSRIGFGPRFGLEVAGLIGAVAAGVGIGALVFDGGSNDSPSTSPSVRSAPGPAELSMAEFLEAEKAIHNAYMEAQFGSTDTHVTTAPGVTEMSEAEWVTAQKTIHDAYMDAQFGPYTTGSTASFEPSLEFDVEAARYQHDQLIPVGGD